MRSPSSSVGLGGGVVDARRTSSGREASCRSHRRSCRPPRRRRRSRSASPSPGRCARRRRRRRRSSEAPCRATRRRHRDDGQELVDGVHGRVDLFERVFPSRVRSPAMAPAEPPCRRRGCRGRSPAIRARTSRTALWYITKQLASFRHSSNMTPAAAVEPQATVPGLIRAPGQHREYAGGIAVEEVVVGFVDRVVAAPSSCPNARCTSPPPTCVSFAAGRRTVPLDLTSRRDRCRERPRSGLRGRSISVSLPSSTEKRPPGVIG